MHDLFLCECESHDHMMIVSNDEEGYVFVSIHLTPLPLFQRIVNAVSYIFGKRSIYGDFEEILLGPEKTQELIQILTNHALTKR